MDVPIGICRGVPTNLRVEGRRRPIDWLRLEKLSAEINNNWKKYIWLWGTRGYNTLYRLKHGGRIATARGRSTSTTQLSWNMALGVMMSHLWHPQNSFPIKSSVNIMISVSVKLMSIYCKNFRLKFETTPNLKILSARIVEIKC